MSGLYRLKALFRAMQTISSVYGRGSNVVLWFRMFMTVLEPRLPQLLRSPQRLDLSFEGKPFSLWMEDRTGIAAFEEVFIRGEYALDIRDPHSIVDAGANIGVASVYFLLRYPNARLYAIEPNPDVLATLKRNLAPFPNASVHHYALSDADGMVELHVHPTSSIASSLSARAKGGRVVTVQSRTLDTFRRELGLDTIDLLKFDIEGAEDKMLGSIEDMRTVHCYVGEVHADLMDTSVEDIRGLFKKFDVKIEPISSKRFVLMAWMIE